MVFKQRNQPGDGLVFERIGIINLGCPKIPKRSFNKSYPEVTYIALQDIKAFEKQAKRKKKHLKIFPLLEKKRNEKENSSETFWSFSLNFF